MSSTRDSWWLDLVGVAGAALIPVAMVLGDVGPTPVQRITAVPLLILWPGYALVSAAFPEARETGDPPFTDETGAGLDQSSRSRFRGLSGIDRLGVSVAASAAITPTVALVQYLRRGVILAPTLALGLGMVTVAFVCLALARRLRLPRDNRFAVAPLAVGSVVTRYFRSNGDHLSTPAAYEATSTWEVALNVLVVIAFLVAVTSAGFAFAQPPPSQEYSELAVLTQNASGGYVADDYPTDLTDADPLYVSVTNNHDTTRTYVLVGSLEAVAADGTVTDRDVQVRTTVELAPGERRVVRHDADATIDADRLRLRYRIRPKSGERAGEWTRSVHVWVAYPSTDNRTTTPDGPTAASARSAAPTAPLPG